MRKNLKFFPRARVSRVPSTRKTGRPGNEANIHVYIHIKPVIRGSCIYGKSVYTVHNYLCHYQLHIWAKENSLILKHSPESSL